MTERWERALQALREVRAPRSVDGRPGSAARQRESASGCRENRIVEVLISPAPGGTSSEVISRVVASHASL